MTKGEPSKLHLEFAKGAMAGHEDELVKVGCNPPQSSRQQRYMGAELARLRAGKKTQTGMSETQLRDYARKPKGGYRKGK